MWNGPQKDQRVLLIKIALKWLVKLLLYVASCKFCSFSNNRDGNNCKTMPVSVVANDRT